MVNAISFISSIFIFFFFDLNHAVASTENIVISKPITEYSLSVAYDCLASLSLYSLGRRESLDRAILNAEVLTKMILIDDSGRRGWGKQQVRTKAWERNFSTCGIPGSISVLGKSRCNPANTSYMIQTGYGLACLAQVSVATESDKYVKLAEEIASDSWDIGISPSGTNDFFYYWYSYDSYNSERYVRNTNAIMGLGMTWLYVATGNDRYRKRALAIARAENREINSSNLGYFGIDDPRYRANPKVESERIENHILHQVKALKDISVLLGYPQALDDSKAMLDAFLNCRNKRCRPENCKAWAAPLSCKATATIAPCILVDQGEPYQSRCEAVVNALPRLNAFQIFLRYSPNDPRKLRPDNH
jgi:hypothetical protein